MNLVLLTHPAFLGSWSQANFARMLMDAFRARGHTVVLRQPEARVRAKVGAGPLAKWAGYVDQYLLFPQVLRRSMHDDPADTLYVFCDQALGPWIPLVADRPHVVHCHDLLALRSALGDIPENPTSWTGRIYQRFIRQGFRQARHFISISQQSRADLHRFGAIEPLTSEVVYNGLNHPYQAIPRAMAAQRLSDAGIAIDGRGCLLHVGGGQWYKNTIGVVHLYAAYAEAVQHAGGSPLPLWIVGPPPADAVAAAVAQLPPTAQVRFHQGLDNATMEALYCHAEALLFPSLAEGFGWPIAEALACGCPVITTDMAPMTEVGGDAATYLPRLARDADFRAWALAGAQVLQGLLSRAPHERERVAEQGFRQASRFVADDAIESYLAIYQRVLTTETLTRRKA